jgi:hypothetical protein
MYGSVLYVTGPFVLALLPARGLGQLSRTYLVNLMTFQAWGLIYAILQVLMSAVNLSSINAVLNANGVLNSFVGSSQMILLALTASIFSLSIALIPFIASRIVRGEVGGTMMTVVSAITTTASMAAASFSGMGEGALASHAAGGGAAPPAPPPAGLGTASSAPAAAGASVSPVGGAAAAAIASTSMPPTSPSGSTTSGVSAAIPSGESSDASSATTTATPAPSSVSAGRSFARPGQHRGFNIPHAMAWYVGHSLGSAYRGLREGE